MHSADSAPNTHAKTEPSSETVTAELLAREPIFHRPEFAFSLTQFDRMMAPDYWEIGASGRRYTRSYILKFLATHPPVDAAQAGWTVLEPLCRPLGPATYLFTYTLHQGSRRSHRATVWRRAPSGWQILYHQGTLLSEEQSGSEHHD
ncbi:MAG: DUF4440 domain-containing protein [Acidobacteriota bacterium]|nr:DUF4440 domain-containing protein [Acidobacteriota bacterium]